MPEKPHSPGFFEGNLLVAMPNLGDTRFARAVIFVCAHSDDGAMGLVINRLMPDLTFTKLLEQLEVDHPVSRDLPIHFGGPVESARGFVLHSADYTGDETLVMEGNVALTATVDILREIAAGGGPRRNLLALGYAGWGPGQLEAEVHENAWLNVAADEGLLFDPDVDDKWEQALRKLGVDAAMLSGTAGRA